MKPEIVYLNGEYKPAAEAKVSVFDRGFMFADGIYEVVPAYNNQLFLADQHWQRLSAGLKALAIDENQCFATDNFHANLSKISNELITKNNIASGNAKIYWQVTRGSSGQRKHHPTNAKPTILATCEEYPLPDYDTISVGFSAITYEQKRDSWQRHKTISILPNMLALAQAKQQGADEAILYNENCILEGCHSNVFVVQGDTLLTPNDQLPILCGVTRNLVLELAAKYGIKTKQTTISTEQLQAADEIILTGSTKSLWPITKLNNQNINNGQAGPIWKKLFAALCNAIQSEIIKV